MWSGKSSLEEAIKAGDIKAYYSTTINQLGGYKPGSLVPMDVVINSNKATTDAHIIVSGNAMGANQLTFTVNKQPRNTVLVIRIKTWFKKGLTNSPTTSENHVYHEVMNKASFQSTILKYQYSATSGSGKGNVVGELNDFTIVKTDKNNSLIRNNPAEFLLKKEEGTPLERRATSNDGRLSFSGLKPGTYKLVEAKAPNGYSIEKENGQAKEYTVVIDSNGNATINGRPATTANPFPIKNPEGPQEPGPEPETKGAKFELSKADGQGQALAGAEFTLTKKDQSGLGATIVKTTDITGKITFDKLSPGNYSLQETQVPIGYENTHKAYDVHVSEDYLVTITEKDSPSEKADVSITQSSLSGKNLSVEVELQKGSKQGQVFSLKLENTLNFGDQTSYYYPDNLVDSEGKVLALANYNKLTNSVDYELTKHAEEKAKDTEFILPRLDHKISINRQAVLSKDNVTTGPGILSFFRAALSIGNPTFTANYSIIGQNEDKRTGTIDIDYPHVLESTGTYGSGSDIEYAKDFMNAKHAITRANESTGKLEYVIYLNPNDTIGAHNKQTSLYLSSDSGVKFNNKTKVQVYKIPNSAKGTAMVDSMAFDPSNLNKINKLASYVTQGYKTGGQGASKQSGNFIRINFKNTDFRGLDEKNQEKNGYIVKVTTDYDSSKEEQKINFAWVVQNGDNNIDARDWFLADETSIDTPYNETKTPGIRVSNPSQTDPKGEIVIDKTDQDGKALAGAEFSLKKEGFSQTAISNDTGKVVFSNLDPGVYILEETKALEGYQESDKTWKIVVTKLGHVFVQDPSDPSVPPVDPDDNDVATNPQDIGSSLERVEETISAKEAALGPNDQISYKLKVKVPKTAKEGDYFYLTLSNTLTHDQLNPNSEVVRIYKDQDGNPLLKEEQTKAVQDPNAIVPLGRIKYTLLQPGKVINSLLIKHDHYIRREVVTQNGQYGFSYGISGPGVSDNGILRNKQVEYPPYNEAGETYFGNLQLNAANRLYDTDNKAKTYGQYFYINPKGRDYGNDGVQIEVGPYTNSQIPETAAKIDPASTTIKIYKVTNNSGNRYINDSISPILKDTSGIRDITENSEIKFENGRATVKIQDVGNFAYIVDVKSEMDSNVSATLLSQAGIISAIDSNGNIISYGKLSIRSQITVGGTIGDGDTITPGGETGDGENPGTNSATIWVTNIKKKTGEFTINKVDDKNTPLEGAEFTLTRLGENGQPLEGEANVFTGTSAEKTGQVIFKDLEPGTYVLIETMAPKGYKVSDKEWVVVVDPDGITSVTEKGGEATFDNLIIKKQGKVDIETQNYKFAEIESTLTKDQGENQFRLNLKISPSTYRNLNGIVLFKVNENFQLLDTFNVASDGSYYYQIGELGSNHAPKNVVINVKAKDASKLITDIPVLDTLKYNGNYGQSYSNLQTIDSIIPTVRLEKTITPKGSSEITVKNIKEPRGEFEITKVDNEKNPLPDAVFNLVNLDNGSTVDVTSDENGKIKFKGLNPGEYLLKEKTASEGYIKSDQEWKIRVTKEGEKLLVKVEKKIEKEAIILGEEDIAQYSPGLSSKITKIDTKNKTFTYRVYFNKNDYQLSSENYPKLEITLPTVNQASTISYSISRFTSKPSFNYAESGNLESVGGYVSGAYDKGNGVLSINLGNAMNFANAYNILYLDLTANYEGDTINPKAKISYYSQGYQNYAATENFGKINDVDATFYVPIEDNPITVENKKIPVGEGKIEILKVDKSNQNKPLAGAEFTLIKEKATTDQVDFPPIVKESGKDGRITFDKIPEGTYILKETRSPEGYEQSDKEWKIKVTKASTTLIGVDVEEPITTDKPLSIPNTVHIPTTEKGKGKVEINKLGSGKPLNGAKFTLFKGRYTETNLTEVETQISGLNKIDGNIVFNNIEPGVYTIKETKAPDGYQISKRSWTVIVYENGYTEAFLNPIDGGLTPGETEVKNVNNLLDGEVTSFQVFPKGPDTQYPGADTIYPNNAGIMKMDFTMKQNPNSANNESKRINPGDYFTVDIDDKLDDHGISPKGSPRPIYNDKEEIIALGKMEEINGNRVIKYVFTDYIAGLSDIEIKGSILLTVDRNKVTRDSTINLVNIIAGDNKNSTFNGLKVEYGNYGVSDQVSFKTLFTEHDKVNGTFVNYMYVNPLGNSMLGTTLDIYNYRPQGGSYSAIYGYQSSTRITRDDIKIFEVSTDQNINPSFGVDDTAYKDVTANFKNSVEIYDEIYSGKRIRVNFGNVMQSGKRYIVKVAGKIDQTQGQGLYLDAKLSSTGYYSGGYIYTNPTYLMARNAIKNKEASSSGGGVNIGDSPILKISNLKLPGFTFIKVNEAEIGLEGAEFILKGKGLTEEGELKDISLDAKSDSTGRVTFSNLKPGSYTLEEKTPPKGYEKIEGAIATITVDQDNPDKIGVVIQNDQYMKLIDGDYKLINKQTPMKFYIDKLDGKTKESIKEGTLKVKLESLLKEENGVNPKYSKEIEFDLAGDSTTDTKGYVEIEGNTPTKQGLQIDIPVEWQSGIYIIIETKAPKGYVMSSKEYRIKIDTEAQTIDLLKGDSGEEVEKNLYKKGDSQEVLYTVLVIENFKAEYPSTGGIGSIPFLLGGTALMAIAVLGFRRRSPFEINKGGGAS